MFDIVARSFRDFVDHLIHLRDDLLQAVRLFAEYFVRDRFVRESHNALQPVQKAQWHLVVLGLSLQ